MASRKNEAIVIHTVQSSRTRALMQLYHGVTDKISYLQGKLERVLGTMVHTACLLYTDDITKSVQDVRDVMEHYSGVV